MAFSFTKKRSCAFTDSEVCVLLNEVRSRRNLLLSRHNNANTIREKSQAWEAIAMKVSAEGKEKRTSYQVRTKWRDMKKWVLQSQKGCKTEVLKMNASEPSPLTVTMAQYIDQVLSIIGPESSWQHDIVKFEEGETSPSARSSVPVFFGDIVSTEGRTSASALQAGPSTPTSFNDSAPTDGEASPFVMQVLPSVPTSSGDYNSTDVEADSKVLWLREPSLAGEAGGSERARIESDEAMMEVMLANTTTPSSSSPGMAATAAVPRQRLKRKSRDLEDDDESDVELSNSCQIETEKLRQQYYKTLIRRHRLACQREKKEMEKLDLEIFKLKTEMGLQN